jgi:hypothetical protein
LSTVAHLFSDTGVLFDGIVDKKFGFGSDPGDRGNQFRGYQVPWVGVLHNPPHVPPWFGLSANEILASEQWAASLDHCVGLFTLSNYLADWLSPRVSVDVCSLTHPTEDASALFNMGRYTNNPCRSVIHVGWWLRKFKSFYMLRARSHNKILLHIDKPWVNRAILSDLEGVKTHQAQNWTVRSYLKDGEYDELLSESVVFLDLYDSSANNVVVECIARCTPLLVCRHPAVEEYLGQDYPLYFSDLSQAGRLLEDDRCIEKAHTYLFDNKALRTRISGMAFARELESSTIYQKL